MKKGLNEAFLGKEEWHIKTFKFEVIDNTIHILDYPNADIVLTLPDDKLVKQLKDMQLHWWDLMEAKQSLESMSINNPDIVNRALAQNSIVTFYKCFGKNEFRSNSLKRNKILAGYPPEAKAVFDYYYDLRNKFIAHDESRYAQVFTGVILEYTYRIIQEKRLSDKSFYNLGMKKLTGCSLYLSRLSFFAPFFRFSASLQ